MAPPRPTTREWRNLSEKRRAEVGHCEWCGNTEASELTLDHQIPHALNGPSTSENAGLVLCRSCNAKKGTTILPPRITWTNDKYL